MKQSIAFSQMLSGSSNLAVIFCTECPQARVRGKREIAEEWLRPEITAWIEAKVAERDEAL